MRLLVGWREEIDDSLGVVEIRWPDNAVSWARAESIQGVDFEETAREVIGALLGEGEAIE